MTRQPVRGGIPARAVNHSLQAPRVFSIDRAGDGVWQRLCHMTHAPDKAQPAARSPVAGYFPAIARQTESPIVDFITRIGNNVVLGPIVISAQLERSVATDSLERRTPA